MDFQVPLTQIVQLSTDGATDFLINSAWNRVLNFDRAAALLWKNGQDTVSHITESLSFRYVRIWNCFSDDLQLNAKDPDGNYNNSLLDQVLDFIVSRHLKPFLVLEEKPKRINRSFQSALVNENAPLCFDSKEQFAFFFSHELHHWMKRYGREEVAGWILEVVFNGILITGLESYEK